MRLHLHVESGVLYRVRLVPRERAGARGVDPRLNALTFETWRGQWVGSVPLYHNVALESLRGADLDKLLEHAVGHG